MWTFAQVEDGTWEVRDAAGNVVGTGPTRDAALAATAEAAADALRVLQAEGDDAPTATGRRFELTYEEGDISVDNGELRRVIDPGATRFDRFQSWGVLPVTATREVSWGHEGATLVGLIDEAERTGDTTILLRGRFLSDETAQEYQALMEDGALGWHSPDPGEVVEELECTEMDDEWGYCLAGILHYTDLNLLGTTLLPHPALTSAVGRLVDAAAEPAREAASVAAAAVERAVAARAHVLASAAPAKPDPDWFTMAEPPDDDPRYGEVIGRNGRVVGQAIPLTVTDAGQVYGHLAPEGLEHIGLAGSVTPPRSPSGYAYFNLNERRTADGRRALVGNLVAGGGHAGSDLDWRATQAYYDRPDLVAAHVHASDGRYGPWLAGALRSSCPDELIETLLAHPPSGDWRLVGGNLDLVAVCSVNTPGYPVVRMRRGRDEAGEEQVFALVAAGAAEMTSLARRRDGLAPVQAGQVGDAALAERVERMERALRLLRPDMEARAEERLRALRRA